MTADTFDIIDKEIEKLINDKKEYNFLTLKYKVEAIVKSIDIFLIDNQANSKVVDLYLKNVITRRNNLKKKHEESKTKTYTKEEKYSLIENICKKLEFASQEAVIKKVEDLEMKSILELTEIRKSLS